MTISRVSGVRVRGVVTVVPSRGKSIEEDAHLWDLDSHRIERLKREIGINKRHVVSNSECASDLCEQAAKILLSRLDLSPQSINGFLMVTQTPDYSQPATSCILHSKLGLSVNCAAFDINLGCSGYVYGLWLSSLMVSSGSCERVLLLAGDTLSRCVSPSDRSVAPLFGDAGSASLIEKAPDEEEIIFALHTDGTGYKHLIIPAGGFREPHSEETGKMVKREDGNKRSDEHLYMNGAEIFTFSIREVPALIEETLAASGWQKDDVDYFILHQANKFINQNIVRKLRIPMEKVPADVFTKYGNQSSASIPAVICENLSLVLNKKQLNLVLAGFGAGLSWAACALKLGPLDCPPILVIA